MADKLLWGGLRIKLVHGWWKKSADRRRYCFFRLWGKQCLSSQAAAIARLGDMAPEFRFINPFLIAVRDVGSFDEGYGRTWLTLYLKGTVRLRTPFNDIRPRNIGANHQIFDPAFHPVQRCIYALAAMLFVICLVVYGFKFTQYLVKFL